MNQTPIINNPTPDFDNLNMDPHLVTDLRAAYHSIPLDAQVNKVSLLNIFDNADEEYLVGANNHFQGMARSRDGQYIFVSGGYKKEKKSHLFILKMDSYLSNIQKPSVKQKKRQYLSNSFLTDQPNQMDTGLNAYIIDTDFWHAGGISLMGDILAVALEKNGESRIDLLNVSDPESPTRIKTIINRRAAKAGCVSIIRLPNNHFLVAIWTEKAGHRFDFYLSETTDVNSTYSGPITVPYDDIIKLPDSQKPPDTQKPRIQNMQFVKDKNDQLGIVGLFNTSIMSLGKDMCYFLTLNLDSDALITNPTLKPPTVKEELVIHTRTNRSYYNFGHVGGVYVDGEKRLIIYGGGTKRKGDNRNHFSFVEFAPLMTNSSLLSEFPSGLIELFGYKKGDITKISNILKLEPSIHPKIDIYKNIKGLGGNFNDKAGGVKWCLPDTTKVFLYEDSRRNTGDDGSKPDPLKKNRVTLMGSGAIQNFRVTPNNRFKYPNKHFWNKASSHFTS